MQAILLQINAQRPPSAIVVPEFGAVLARYELEDMPDRDSTATSYESYIRKHIRPRWAEVLVDSQPSTAIGVILQGSLRPAPWSGTAPG